MTKAENQPSGDKPLGGASKLALASGTGAMILLFYVFVVASILTLLVLLLLELAVVLALARFGGAGPMVRVMNRHLAPLPIFFRSLWVRKGVEFRISLQPVDAPGLFTVLRSLCDRVEVALPRTVSIEMTVNAWVRLKGYRRGAGTTVLGIGYDLLAGLCSTEIEAVLAHEMAHAKWVQRGFKRWLVGGLNRATQLAHGLAVQAEAERRARRPNGATAFFLRGADWLTRSCARLVAAWSRQDEFEADRAAAQICGAEAMRSALVKTESIARVAARLPWRERVAQLQLGNGFSHWLIGELKSGETVATSESGEQPFSKYSTHPTLNDRLAALDSLRPGFATGSVTVFAKDTTPATPGEDRGIPGLGLLADPDKVAEELIVEIQRVAALEEERDSKALDRWSRKVHAHSHLRPIQSLGILAALLGLIFGLIVWLTVGVSVGLVEFMVATVVPGVVCYRFPSSAPAPH